ncbi:transcriptional regulator [Empedobacter falsenii]|uniref:Tetratricopeptide repeat protein n=1 Tax=Empedobacter falsenii TaxID=343874 RepID=A0AAW7DKG5_9FLAO|nr:tetratricopeptide repeat protein [Empedobacter falsenii]MDM1551067.1 tetratricopeptide repeat protein [Empedobacter falsenii]
MKVSIFFTLLLFPFLFLSSFSSINKNDERILIEKIIEQNKNVTDSIQLQNNFKKLGISSTSFLSKSLKSIYQVYLANLYAQTNDKLNKKSNSLFESALKVSKNVNSPELQIWVNTQFGYYYYNFSQYQNAYPYFMEASKLLDLTKDEDIFSKSDVYKKNAFYFMNVKEFDKSEKYLLLALKYTNKKDNEYGTILNAIGHVFMNNNINKANNYFELTKEYAIQNKDEIRYAKALGDIASINILNKQYDLAIDNLKKDIEISKKLKNARNLMYANIQLGKLYLQLDRIDDAKIILNEAKDYASQKIYLNSFEYDIYKILLEIALKNNNTNEELLFRRKLDELELELQKTDGQNVINEINWKIQQENFNFKYEAEKAKQEKTTILKNALFLISFLLIIIILFVIISYRRKIKIQNSTYDNKILSIQNDKLKSENKLNKTAQTLESYKTYLSEKNKQIVTLKNEINSISNSSATNKEKQYNELVNLLDSHLMTEESWVNFKNIFAHEQNDFVKYLSQNFPSLTESNLRTIYLLKLGLNNLEISQILGISADSVKKSKQRLKKKYKNFDQIFQDNGE